MGAIYSHRALSRDQIRRLDSYRVARRLDVPQLNLAMSAPFVWHTLFRALHGKPVRQRNHQFIVQWIERFLPEKPVVDGKAAAAGNGEVNAER
jgi:hypothetical protein